MKGELRLFVWVALASAFGCSKPAPPAPAPETTKPTPSVTASSSANANAPVTVATGLVYPARHLATDGKFLYWTSPGQQNTSGHHEDGVVMKVAVEGGKVASLATGLHNPEAMAIDDKAIYFTSRGTEGKYALNDDGAVLKLSKDGGAPTTLASGRKQPTEIALRDKDVFFLDIGSWSPVKGMPFAHKSNPNGAVSKVSRDGGAVMTIATGLTSPHALAVDATRVYWTLEGKEDTTIFGAPRGGGAAKSLSVVKPRAISLEADGGGVVFAKPLEASVEILRLPAAGGEPTKVTTVMSSVTALLAEDGTIYFALLSGDIRVVRKGVTTPVTLATGQGEVRAMTVDSGHLYWASGDHLVQVAK